MSADDMRLRENERDFTHQPRWPVISRRYGRLIRWSAALAAVTSLLLGAIGYLAFRETGMLITAVIPLAFILMAAGWLWVLWVTPRHVHLRPDSVEIIWLLRRLTLRYDEILAIENSPRAIELRLLGRTRAIRRLAGNDDVWLLKQLRRRAPAAQEAFRRQMAAGLPLTIHARRAVPAVFFAMGVGLILIGAGLTRYVLTNYAGLVWVDWLIALVMIAALVAIGAFFAYQFLWTIVWRYTFTPTEIVLTGLLKKRRIAAHGIQAVRHEALSRPVRGVPRTLHRLVIEFAASPPLTLTPNGENFPLDYVDDLEGERLGELATRLQHHYVARRQEEKRREQTSSKATANQAWRQLMRRIAANREDFGIAFETYRDEILAFGPEVMPEVLEMARRGDIPWALELWAMVLADAAFPPAMATFVAWLGHDNEQLRFIAAMALDELADGRFNIDGLVDGGWIHHDEIQRLVPAIREWWRREGQAAVPDVARWAASRQAQKPLSARDKRFTFVENNPDWIMLGDGTVDQLLEGESLPPNVGLCVVGGDVLLFDEAIPRPAALEMDSEKQRVAAVFVREGNRWIDATPFCTWVQPRFTFDGDPL